MQSTFQKFIDPANIPKKYGGELDFEFGKMPVLDPALKDLITWEDSYTDFPHGPMFWHDRGDFIELEAVGSVDKKERREMVCKLRKLAPNNVYSEKQNGQAITGATPQRIALKPELLRAPTEKEDVPLVAAPGKIPDAKGEADAAPMSKAADLEPKLVKVGELVSASDPEPVFFVTAKDNLNTLSQDENPIENVPSSESHDAATGMPLEAEVKENGIPTEDPPGHGEVLTKITTGKHSVESRASLDSGKKSNKSSGSLKKRILGMLRN
jgi:hypothetical protein